jgi:hypothetical protein
MNGKKERKKEREREKVGGGRGGKKNSQSTPWLIKNDGDCES